MLASNQKLSDVAIGKQLYLERFKIALVGQSQPELDRYLRELLKSVSLDISQRDFSTMSKGTLDSLLRSFRAVEREQRPKFRAALLRILRGFNDLELGLQRALWAFLASENSASPELEAVPEDESDKAWIALLATVLGTGQTVAGFVDRYLDSIRVSFEDSIRSAYALEEPSEEAIAALVALGIPASKKLSAVVRTVVQASAAAVVFDRVASHYFPEYIWLSLIDSVTTAVCQSRNRKIYRIGFGPKPPAHVGCRSTTAPVRKKSPQANVVSLAAFRKQQAPGIAAAMFAASAMSGAAYTKAVLGYGTETNDHESAA